MIVYRFCLFLCYDGFISRQTSVGLYLTLDSSFLVTKLALPKLTEKTVPSHVPVVWAPATVTSSRAVYANQAGQESGVVRTSMSVRRCRLKWNAWRKAPSVLILKEDMHVDVHRVSRRTPVVFVKVSILLMLFKMVSILSL